MMDEGMEELVEIASVVWAAMAVVYWISSDFERGEIDVTQRHLRTSSHY